MHEATAQRRESGSAENPRADLLTMASDVGLAGILFVAPLFMGGRHPMGRFVFIVCALVFAGAWLVRQCLVKGGRWRHSVAEWIAAAGIVLLLLQLMPLSPALLQAVAPNSTELLPLWTSADEGSALGTWQHVTLTASETRAGLALFLAYALTFFVAAQRITRLGEAERTLKWIAAAAVFMALLGLVQSLTSNGKFVWVYEHPFRTVRGVQGSFINRNHFAQLLAIGVGPLGFWTLVQIRRRLESNSQRFGTGAARSSDREQFAPIVLAIATGILLFAGLSSLSRGGAVAIATALLASGVGFYACGYLQRKHLIGVTAIVAVLGVSLFIHGYDRVAGRLDDLTSMSIDQLDRHQGRRKLWEANWAAFTARPWLGYGVGSHREFYKVFMPNKFALEFTHAENGYLQVASEAGAAGLALLLSGIAACAYWSFIALRLAASRRAMACAVAASAGLLASLVHAVADFVWYIPACMSWTLLLMAIVCRLSQLARAPREQQAEADGTVLPRLAWVALAVFVVAAGIWMTSDRWPAARASKHWDNYLKRSQELAELDEQDTDKILFGEAPDNEQAREMLVAQMIDDLQQYLRIDPHYGRAHVRMAATCLRHFQNRQRYAENAMDLTQIRDAAMVSEFPTREQLNDWLDRAVGDHRVYLDRALWHARRSLRYCPLQGESYLFLAELCFLENARSQTKQAYIDQALRVRPHDGYVLFVAGKEALLTGDAEAIPRAMEYWKQCFHSGSRHQHQLAGLLAGRVPVAFFLENFKPQLADWLPIYSHFGRIEQPDELRAMCRYFVAQAEQEPELAAAPESARMWLAIYRIFEKLGDSADADTCAGRVLACDPDDYRNRSTLAMSLLESEKFAQAEEQFRWCLHRRPHDKRMRLFLTQAVRGKISQPRSADLRQPGGMLQPR